MAKHRDVPDTGRSAGLLNGIHRRLTRRSRQWRQEMNGGARARACEQAWERSRSGAKLCQTTGLVERSTALDVDVCGLSTGTPVCSTLHAEQQPSWARWPDWSSCPAPAVPLPWQMVAAASGSDAARLAAQHAPIGAKICTNRATRNTGRNFFSRRRIADPSKGELTTMEAGSRDWTPAYLFPPDGNSWRAQV